METSETIRTSLQTGPRGVVYVHRFQRRLFSYNHSEPVQKISNISCPGSDISVQSTAIWSIHSTWLVEARCHQTCLQHTQTLVAICQDLGWLVNREKSELDPKQVFNFVGYQFDLKEGTVRPTLDQFGPATPVPRRAFDSHRKTGPPWSTPNEAHTVAPEKQLEGSRLTRKGDNHSQVAPPSSEMVAGGKQCASRSTLTPTKTYSADLYRHIKRRVGR